MPRSRFAAVALALALAVPASAQQPPEPPAAVQVPEIVVSATPSQNTVRFYMARGYQPMAEPMFQQRYDIADRALRGLLVQHTFCKSPVRVRPSRA